MADPNTPDIVGPIPDITDDHGILEFPEDPELQRMLLQEDVEKMTGPNLQLLWEMHTDTKGNAHARVGKRMSGSVDRKYFLIEWQGWKENNYLPFYHVKDAETGEWEKREFDDQHHPRIVRALAHALSRDKPDKLSIYSRKTDGATQVLFQKGDGPSQWYLIGDPLWVWNGTSYVKRTTEAVPETIAVLCREERALRELEVQSQMQLGQTGPNLAGLMQKVIIELSGKKEREPRLPTGDALERRIRECAYTEGSFSAVRFHPRWKDIQRKPREWERVKACAEALLDIGLLPADLQRFQMDFSVTLRENPYRNTALDTVWADVSARRTVPKGAFIPIRGDVSISSTVWRMLECYSDPKHTTPGKLFDAFRRILHARADIVNREMTRPSKAHRPLGTVPSKEEREDLHRAWTVLNLRTDVYSTASKMADRAPALLAMDDTRFDPGSREDVQLYRGIAWWFMQRFISPYALYEARPDEAKTERDPEFVLDMKLAPLTEESTKGRTMNLRKGLEVLERIAKLFSEDTYDDAWEKNARSTLLSRFMQKNYAKLLERERDIYVEAVGWLEEDMEASQKRMTEIMEMVTKYCGNVGSFVQSGSVFNENKLDLLFRIITPGEPWTKPGDIERLLAESHLDKQLDGAARGIVKYLQLLQDEKKRYFALRERAERLRLQQRIAEAELAIESAPPDGDRTGERQKARIDYVRHTLFTGMPAGVLATLTRTKEPPPRDAVKRMVLSAAASTPILRSETFLEAVRTHYPPGKHYFSETEQLILDILLESIQPDGTLPEVGAEVWEEEALLALERNIELLKEHEAPMQALEQLSTPPISFGYSELILKDQFPYKLDRLPKEQQKKIFAFTDLALPGIAEPIRGVAVDEKVYELLRDPPPGLVIRPETIEEMALGFPAEGTPNAFRPDKSNQFLVRGDGWVKSCTLLTEKDFAYGTEDEFGLVFYPIRVRPWERGEKENVLTSLVLRGMGLRAPGEKTKGLVDLSGSLLLSAEEEARLRARWGNRSRFIITRADRNWCVDQKKVSEKAHEGGAKYSSALGLWYPTITIEYPEEDSTELCAVWGQGRRSGGMTLPKDRVQMVTERVGTATSNGDVLLLRVPEKVESTSTPIKVTPVVGGSLSPSAGAPPPGLSVFFMSWTDTLRGGRSTVEQALGTGTLTKKKVKKDGQETEERTLSYIDASGTARTLDEEQIQKMEQLQANVMMTLASLPSVRKILQTIPEFAAMADITTTMAEKFILGNNRTKEACHMMKDVMVPGLYDYWHASGIRAEYAKIAKFEGLFEKIPAAVVKNFGFDTVDELRKLFRKMKVLIPDVKDPSKDPIERLRTQVKKRGGFDKTFTVSDPATWGTWFMEEALPFLVQIAGAGLGALVAKNPGIGWSIAGSALAAIGMHASTEALKYIYYNGLNYNDKWKPLSQQLFERDIKLGQYAETLGWEVGPATALMSGYKILGGVLKKHLAASAEHALQRNVSYSGTRPPMPAVETGRRVQRMLHFFDRNKERIADMITRVSRGHGRGTASEVLEEIFENMATAAANYDDPEAKPPKTLSEWIESQRGNWRNQAAGFIVGLFVSMGGGPRKKSPTSLTFARYRPRAQTSGRHGTFEWHFTHESKAPKPRRREVSYEQAVRAEIKARFGSDTKIYRGTDGKFWVVKETPLGRMVNKVSPSKVPGELRESVEARNTAGGDMRYDVDFDHERNVMTVEYDPSLARDRALGIVRDDLMADGHLVRENGNGRTWTIRTGEDLSESTTMVLTPRARVPE